MRILASDGMEKNAVAALTAAGHEVVEQFYEPAELAEQVKNFDVLVVRSATKVGSLPMIFPVKVMFGAVPVVNVPCAQPPFEGGLKAYVSTAAETV